MKHYLSTLSIGASALLLAACGGGGGGSGGGVASLPPPPTSTPTPTPTPTPSSMVIIFPNVTTSTDFATLGLESPGHPIQANSLVRDGFSVFYDARSNAYFMDLPSTQLGLVEARTTGDRYWNGQLSELSFGFAETNSLNVFRPGPQNFDLALTYTSFAEYTLPSGRFGEVAFGQATPAGAVPITGSATYSAFAAGYLGGAIEDIPIRGSATLQFNFGAGSLTGSFDPYIYDLLAGHTALGHYEFANTVFGVGRTTFSGELSTSGTNARGAFNGLFTGPVAQELMARWTAPFHDPSTNTDTLMFGVWVGKRP